MLLLWLSINVIIAGIARHPNRFGIQYLIGRHITARAQMRVQNVGEREEITAGILALLNALYNFANCFHLFRFRQISADQFPCIIKHLIIIFGRIFALHVGQRFVDDKPIGVRECRIDITINALA